MTSSHSRRSRQSRAACVQGSLPPIRMCFPRRKLTNTGRWFPDVQNNAWTQILCWHTRPLHNIQNKTMPCNDNVNGKTPILTTRGLERCARSQRQIQHKRQLSRMRRNRQRWCERTLEIKLNKLLRDRLKGDPTSSCSVPVSIGNGWRREDCTAWCVGVNESSPGE